MVTTQEIRKPELKDIRDALNADRVMMALVSTIIFEEEDRRYSALDCHNRRG